MNPEEIEALRVFATPRQAEILDALAAHDGNRTHAANALGIARGSVRKMLEAMKRKAARKNPSLHVDTAPVGYHQRGVSTLVNRTGEIVLQWRKTARDGFDPEAFASAVESAIECLPAAAPVEPPTRFVPDVCNVVPIGDPHYGMLAWPPETGAPWDLKIASETHARALRYLFAKAPRAALSVVVWMGDNAHADDATGLTPASKHALDTDSRWERMIGILFTSMVNSATIALERSERVILRVVKGNHDPHVSAALALALEAYFRNEGRVQVDRTPTPLFVLTWGRVLLSFAHGHAPPPARIPDILAADYRAEMGATEQSYCYTGHKHSKILSERGGVIFEAVQTLAAKDAYATHAGYRSGRGLFIDTYHKSSLVATDRCSVAAQDLGVA